MSNMKNDPRFHALVAVKGAIEGLFSRFDEDPNEYKIFAANTGGARVFADNLYKDRLMADTFVELFNMELRKRQIFSTLPVSTESRGRGPDKAPRTRRTRAEIMAARKEAAQDRHKSGRDRTPPAHMRPRGSQPRQMTAH